MILKMKLKKLKKNLVIILKILFLQILYLI